MLRPESPLRQTAPAEQVLRPLQATSPAGGNAFGALFGELRRDVLDFIENGSGSAASQVATLPTLSAEGQIVRGAAQPRETAAGPAQQEFLAAIAPAAQEAARQLGVAPELVAAHAALESGWGQRPLLQADGRSTHNLFGVKAGESWQGEVAHVLTTEVENGTAVKRVEPFRSYPDASSAFRDYAQLLLDSPRYRGALQAGGDVRAFAEGLARGGYATDPAYADKLTRVAAQIRRPK